MCRCSSLAHSLFFCLFLLRLSSSEEEDDEDEDEEEEDEDDDDELIEWLHTYAIMCVYDCSELIYRYRYIYVCI